jgi:hypothetical protein
VSIEDQINPPAIHGEQVAGRSATVRKHLMSLSINVQASTFDQAVLFFEAQTNSYYLEWGYESLGEYAVRELGIKERKAQYLARIVKVCQDVGVERKNYEPAGVSKLREITTLDPNGFYFDGAQNHPLDELIVDLILDAPDLSFSEVEDKVAIYKGQTKENRMVLRNYKVTQSCWDNVVKPAMELARKKLGSAGRDEAGNAVEYSDGAVLEIICVSFMQDANNFLPDMDESDVDSNSEEEGD